METIPTYKFLIERILQYSMNEILWIVIYTRSKPKIKMDRNIYKTEAAYVLSDQEKCVLSPESA